MLDGFYFSISQHCVLTFLSFSVEFLDVRWISFILNIAWTSEYGVDRSLLPWYVINSFKSHYFLCKLYNHWNTYWTMKGTFISTILLLTMSKAMTLTEYFIDILHLSIIYNIKFCDISHIYLIKIRKKWKELRQIVDNRLFILFHLSSNCSHERNYCCLAIELSKNKGEVQERVLLSRKVSMHTILHCLLYLSQTESDDLLFVAEELSKHYVSTCIYCSLWHLFW